MSLKYSTQLCFGNGFETAASDRLTGYLAQTGNAITTSRCFIEQPSVDQSFRLVSGPDSLTTLVFRNVSGFCTNVSGSGDKPFGSSLQIQSPGLFEGGRDVATDECHRITKDVLLELECSITFKIRKLFK
jgi:hypothetical protein